MFAERLQNTVERFGGGHAAILMGFDGIPVDQFVVDKNTDVETLGMEFSVILKEVRKVAGLLEVGATEELVVKAGQLSTILRVVSDEYFIALFLSPQGNLGKARYLLRVLAPQFRDELS